MGMNIYLHRREGSSSHPLAGVEFPLHVGKFSHGWYFALHVTGETDSWQACRNFLRVFCDHYALKDEEEKEISVEDFINKVENNKWEKENPIDLSNEKGCEIGLGGLIYPLPGTGRCIGKSEKFPVSYILGDFA
jgi:hypothetical protein